MKPVDKIYPFLNGEQCVDQELHNLIVDILEDRFVEGYWDVKEKDDVVHRKKNKDRKAEVIEPPKKKRKEKPGNSDDDKTPENQRDRKDKGPGLVELVEKLYNRFEGMEKSITEMVRGSVTRLEARLEEKFGHMITLIEDRVGLLENEVKQMKDRKEHVEVDPSDANEVHSKVDNEQEFTSKV